MAFVAVAVPLLQVHPFPARAGAPATASHQLIARFTSAAAADRAREIRRRLLSTVDLLPALQGRTATGGWVNLHRAIGDGS
jgi:hypothetical protein